MYLLGINWEVWAPIIEKTVLISLIITVSLVVAMYSTWGERKFAALVQDRRGPSRAGPFGLLQPLADGVKLFMKEEIIPTHSHKVLFILGPCLAMLTAMMTSAVIPWGSDVVLFGRNVQLQVADVNIGILFIFGVVSMGVYGIMIGSWASNNKYSLMGGLRAASQIISYELAMGLALIALLMTTGTLSLRQIVTEQATGTWNVFKQPLGFLIYLICLFAECNRTPFDLPESENELVGGYHTEYSSMKLGFYLFAEYINMFIGSVVISCLYFGGFDILPWVDESTWGLSKGLMAGLSILALLAKAILFIVLFMWVRWTIPRFRYDQLMNLGWKKLIPLALVNLLITGAVLLYYHTKK